MKLIEIYRCLCDETRLRILHLLTRGPLCVCHFQNILSIPQVAVSKHLAYLREYGMVEATRREQWMVYALPKIVPREFEAQLKCLRDCVGEHATFQGDLERMRMLSSAVKAVVSGPVKAVRQRRRFALQESTTNKAEAFPDYLK